MLKKILCAAESEDECELYSFVLTDAGYEVKVAQSLNRALYLMEFDSFDLCLSDIFLTDATGFQLMQEARSIQASLAFIIFSADNSFSMQRRIYQAGAKAFFPKPMDFKSLVEVIDYLLNSIELSTR